MERDKALDMALGQIEKQFGKGAVMRMGENTHMQIEAISTGALSLDIALGIGGLPRGRVVEIFGPESSGKSTLAMHVVAESQRNGGICAYIDAEHAMDPVYAKAIGVNVDDLLISQPDTGEQALEIADMLIRSGALDVVAIDSVAALTPRAEIEGEMGDAHVGLQARLMSQALRKLTATLNKSNTIAIFINQLREKIGISYGSPEVTPGGRALKFYSSVRLDIRRIESIKDGAEVTGNRTRVKVVKNKCVAAGTLVFDPTTGRTHRIEEIVDGGAGVSVVAVDKAGRLEVRPIVERFNQGEAEVIGVELGDGAQLWVTPDHRVLTATGWREAGELGTGDRLARPCWAGRFGKPEPLAAGDDADLLPGSLADLVIRYVQTLDPAGTAVAEVFGRPVGSLRSGADVRRDQVRRLAEALDSPFLREILTEEVWYDRIVAVHPPEWRDIYDIEVDVDHTFVANDIVVSNCAPPFKQAEFDIMYGRGISREGSLLDVAVTMNIVKKSGAWYTYEGEQLGQGRENAKKFLSENLEVLLEIDQAVRANSGMIGFGVAGDVPIGADPMDDEPISLND